MMYWNFGSLPQNFPPPGSTDTYDVLKLVFLEFVEFEELRSTDTYDVLKHLPIETFLTILRGSTDTYDVLKL